MATEEQARSLVEILERELLERSGPIDRYTAYYRGFQPLKFASDEFRKYHGTRYKDFSDNWVQPVADAPVERLTVTGVKPYGYDQADAESWRVWQTNGLDVDSQLGFSGAVIAGRSFALVWGDPKDPDTPLVTFEDATSCIVLYEPGSRRNRRAALRRWQDGEKYCAVLFLPNEVWKFERPVDRQTKTSDMQAADVEVDGWQPRDMADEPNPQRNPMGVVPVVELPNRPGLVLDPISDVAGVVAMQDAVNLLWAHTFTASDAAALPQRVLLGTEVPKIPILNEKGEVIGDKPMDMEKITSDRVAVFTGENAKIGEWTAANLAAFTDVIEIQVGHIAAQTRTPQHYLIGSFSNLSADALLAAETGLVKRVEEKQLWYGQGIREVFALVALAQGEMAKAQALRAGHMVWADAESRSQAQLADALGKMKDIGFPFEFLAARFGLTPSEVVDVMAMKERELAADPVAEITRQMTKDAGPEPSPDEEEPDGDEPTEQAA